MRKILSWMLILLLLIGGGADAAWDATKPATGSALNSAEIRANWTALQQNVGTVNLIADPTFLIWAGGDTVAPTHWVVSGTGDTMARAGTGLADTNRKVGDFCFKHTSGSDTAVIDQKIVPTGASFTRANFLIGQTVSAGAWVRTATASAVRISIYDGNAVTYSSFHTGGSTWQWLTVTATMGASATLLDFRMETNATGVVSYLSGPTVVLGPIPPAYFQPAPAAYGSFQWFIAGAQTTGTFKAVWNPMRPGIVMSTTIHLITAPTGSSFIVDVNKTNATMYTTKPTIAISGFSDTKVPDGTYANRCFNRISVDDSYISFDIDQIGSTIAGSTFFITVKYLYYLRPMEQFLLSAELN
jgi:hypothetical protein